MKGGEDASEARAGGVRWWGGERGQRGSIFISPESSLGLNGGKEANKNCVERRAGKSFHNLGKQQAAESLPFLCVRVCVCVSVCVIRKHRTIITTSLQLPQRV